MATTSSRPLTSGVRAIRGGVQGAQVRTSTPFPSSDLGIDELRRRVKALGRAAVHAHPRWSYGHLAGELRGEAGDEPGAGRVERKFREGDPHQLGAAELVPFTLLFGTSVLDLVESEVGRVAVELPAPEGGEGDVLGALLGAKAADGDFGEALRHALSSASEAGCQVTASELALIRGAAQRLMGCVLGVVLAAERGAK